MKLLALSDLHADEDLLDRLRALAAKKRYDAALFCGDITTRGPVSYAEDALSLFPSTYAVFGNLDTQDVIGKMEEMGVLVHGKKVKFGSFFLAGLGGSNKTPFGSPTEFSEEQISGFLSSAGIDSNTILLSHPPPFGVFDLVGQVHAGSTALRKCIEEASPLMVLCGHIHEHMGQEVFGKSLIVKLPAAQSLLAAEISIGKQIEVDFIKL